MAGIIWVGGGAHNWVESFYGEWHMLEYAENDEDTGWMIQFLNKQNFNSDVYHVFVTSFTQTGKVFFMSWNCKFMEGKNIKFLEPFVKNNEMHFKDFSFQF